MLKISMRIEKALIKGKILTNEMVEQEYLVTVVNKSISAGLVPRLTCIWTVFNGQYLVLAVTSLVLCFSLGQVYWILD